MRKILISKIDIIGKFLQLFGLEGDSYGFNKTAFNGY